MQAVCDISSGPAAEIGTQRKRQPANADSWMGMKREAGKWSLIGAARVSGPGADAKGWLRPVSVARRRNKQPEISLPLTGGRNEIRCHPRSRTGRVWYPGTLWSSPRFPSREGVTRFLGAPTACAHSTTCEPAVPILKRGNAVPSA